MSQTSIMMMPIVCAICLSNSELDSSFISQIDRSIMGKQSEKNVVDRRSNVLSQCSAVLGLLRSIRVGIMIINAPSIIPQAVLPSGSMAKLTKA